MLRITQSSSLIFPERSISSQNLSYEAPPYQEDLEASTSMSKRHEAKTTALFCNAKNDDNRQDGNRAISKQINSHKASHPFSVRFFVIGNVYYGNTDQDNHKGTERYLGYRKIRCKGTVSKLGSTIKTSLALSVAIASAKALETACKTYSRKKHLIYCSFLLLSSQL